jgi:hypothetical protein
MVRFVVVVAADQDEVALAAKAAQAFEQAPVLTIELAKVDAVDRVAVEDEPIKRLLVQHFVDKRHVAVPAA